MKEAVVFLTAYPPVSLYTGGMARPKVKRKLADGVGSQYSIRNNQQMQLYAVNFIPLLSSLYMFRAAHTLIIRSTKFNFIYSHWYNHRLA